MKTFKLLIWTTLVLLIFNFGPLNAQTDILSAKERPKWFTDSRYGMFIHWGLYSAAEGIWKGERHRHFNNYAEWIKYRNRISTEQYGELANRFDWDAISPEEWVILAKKSGMKYITITAKHHDGVAIWNSKVDDYNLSKLSNTDRDIIAELAEACRKHGIKLGFYYSHWIDWAHPYAWNHNLELTGEVSDEQFNQYWQEKVIPQIRELLTNYGDIAMLWFDMWIPYEESIIKKEQLIQVTQMVRELQPNCLINSRLGLPATYKDIDFETLGDNQLGSAHKDHPWQTPGTVAHSWGYNALENQWKSTSQILQALIGNVSLNGNFMLNIGPRADGSLPYEGISRLQDIGDWLAINGESIYQSEGLSLSPNQHDWGKITYKDLDRNQSKVFLHVYNWPLDKILRVTGFKGKPEKIYMLNDKLKTPLNFKQNGPLTHINLPSLAADKYVSVIVMEFDSSLEIDNEIVPEATFGGFSLTGNNNLNRENLTLVKFDGTNPAHSTIDSPSVLKWKIHVPESGQYKLDISFSNQGEKLGKASLKVAQQTLQTTLEPSGKIVVEPNENFHADQYPEKELGTLNFNSPGLYEVELEIEPSKKEAILFNWLWLSKK